VGRVSLNFIYCDVTQSTYIGLYVLYINYFNTFYHIVNKNPTQMQHYADILFTVKSLYMFRVSQHPSSGVLKSVTTACGTGHDTGTATSLQRDQQATLQCWGQY
jgi:hypothetical protein